MPDTIYVVVTVMDGDMHINGVFSNSAAADACFAEEQETFAGHTEILTATVEDAYTPDS